MADFKLPTDLKHNTAMVQNPSEYAKESGCASWLFLVGDEFATMPGGISYAQVQQAIPQSARVVSDPPRVLNLDLARQHIKALDELPRPTLITCRTGPRAAAVAYMYAGLKSNATYDQVIAAAEKADAPFCKFPECREWVKSSMDALKNEVGK